ncbi:Slp family lipoprotein [Nitrospira lenta]|uniref:Putative Outer membrane lipoprotein, Slp family n=1 Tax=Nitrospira lenta TaxID=1436998 RepID=A0A330L772_9BACT|nr:Slp family lipoprotein [Nitrospira lenta]SPP65101.1 putative Outer membrane lipoprotein, Slp family [Nitrospira lenta]
MGIFTKGLLVLFGATLVACAARGVFPPEAVVGVDQNFDFAHWRMVPNQAEAKKIQLGGRIIQSDRAGDSITIVATQLPIVAHPAYGPRDTGKRSGEFAITYQGKIDPSFLQSGNRIMVVGSTHAPKLVSVDDLPRSLPAVVASCLHIWKTGGREIADFPFFGAGYQPLEEDTFCTSTQ